MKAMSYDEFMNAIDKQVSLTCNCKGYTAFKDDVNKLKSDNTGCGLASITANVWLEKICDLSIADLLDYADKYQSGWLNAWQSYN